MKQHIEETLELLSKRGIKKPKIGLILGSGLGVLADEIQHSIKVPYQDIPHFPISTVAGHAGQLVFGELEGQSVIAMSGRFHYYEGYSLEAVTYPVRVFKALGVEQLIVTNAAGGVNTDFNAGDLMIISDHINNMYQNPLMGANDPELGERFPDMSSAYSEKLRSLAKNEAAKLQLNVQEGVYVANTGPCYETPAEVRMIRTIGGDAVGMSTVPEVIVARHSNMEVLGISCISNMAAGILPQPLTHSEVIETTEAVKADFMELVKSIIREMI
ncbi:purine-nucleoside phosphorylase [Alkalihalobacillus trypoxylicola]|uniref:Purine nucleoside phosphorylase n=1 Tax=Alkalihalobacillus trypoxylicola TaxID=519424 RepID=A0A162DSP8_9BACI|nr:purine-nucleoside phosphorylase [Alkalihalobacillus trypoxylicola]KYG30730.1 purine-nucleoside phosphorylase [Alkalihalobacillus trypoxylicola]GAF66730.1 purine nucleoside phosphorylase [Bacillus sp. TS-2]